VGDGLCAVDDGEELLGGAVRGVDVAGAQHEIEEETPLGEEDGERVEAATTVVPVVSGAWLMPMDLEREGVDVESGALDPAPALGEDDTPGALEESGAQAVEILGTSEDVEESRLRGLGRKPDRSFRIGRKERGDPATLGDGEATSGIVAEQIGVDLMAVTAGDEVEAAAEELEERVDDARGVARIVDLGGDGRGEAEAFVELAQGEDAGMGGESSGAPFDGDRPVEGAANRGRLFPGHCGSLALVLWFAQSIRNDEGFVCKCRGRVGRIGFTREATRWTRAQSARTRRSEGQGVVLVVTHHRAREYGGLTPLA